MKNVKAMQTQDAKHLAQESKTMTTTVTDTNLRLIPEANSEEYNGGWINVVATIDGTTYLTGGYIGSANEHLDLSGRPEMEAILYEDSKSDPGDAQELPNEVAKQAVREIMWEHWEEFALPKPTQDLTVYETNSGLLWIMDHTNGLAIEANCTDLGPWEDEIAALMSGKSNLSEWCVDGDHGSHETYLRVWQELRNNPYCQESVAQCENGEMTYSPDDMGDAARDYFVAETAGAL